MARESYDEALRRLLAHEGGYSSHPSDPGGPTKFGITIADYRRYVRPRATATDVRAMRLDEAKAIYRTNYWDALRCDALPAGLDYGVFDYGVNSGVGRASKVLRRLLGFSDHGGIDDAVLAAIRKRKVRDLITRLCDERMAFLKRLRTWPVFGTGWSRRVAEVRSAALAMAARTTKDTQRTTDGTHVPLGHPLSAASGKGAAPLNRLAQHATAGAIAAAGAAAAQQAHHAGARLGVILVIVLVTVAIAVGGWWAWRWHQRRQQEAPN